MKVLGEQVGIDVYSEDSKNSVKVAKNALKHARQNDHQVIILDTAGRLHIELGGREFGRVEPGGLCVRYEAPACDLVFYNTLTPNGDGANDRPMIEAAGLGIAFRAKPVLRDAADCHIDYSDLSAALYFMGVT